MLDSYQELLRNHLVVTLFLTMLVGAGGNAGNQSAIKVIRGLVSNLLPWERHAPHKQPRVKPGFQIKSLAQLHYCAFI